MTEAQTIDRKAFFAAIRNRPFDGFGGAKGAGQVKGVDAILDEWERRKWADLRWLAYILATTKWETAHTMQPIREFGKGAGHPYGVPVNGHVYYGRGFVQLTWNYNYKKMGDLLGVDLLSNPDLALDPTIASKILFEGMVRGSFTGKKLSDYFNDRTADWINARRIINGTDRASAIASIAKQFYEALTGAKRSAAVVAATVVIAAGGGAAAVANSKGADNGTLWLIGGATLVIAVSLFFIVRAWRRGPQT